MARLNLLFVILISVGICRFFLTSETERSYSISIAEMVKLLKLEKELVKNLEEYANELEQKVKILKGALKPLNLEVEKFERDDGEIYLGNPLNSFALLRHMHEDWPKWLKFMKENYAAKQTEFLMTHLDKLPTKTDLKEATEAILILQQTYNMQAFDIANGFLYGKQYDAKLSYRDCYALALGMYHQGEYLEAGNWLSLAIERFTFDDQHMVLGLQLGDIFEFHSDVLQKQKHFTAALQALKQALFHKSNDSLLLKKQVELKKLIAIKQSSTEANVSKSHFRNELFKYVCRKGANCKEKLTLLNCRLKADTDFLKLAPIQMEELHFDPYIAYFHDVLYHKEIKHLQVLAMKYMERARHGPHLDISNSRIAKLFWFDNNKTPTILRVNQRIEDMTGLNATEESLQVANYGIGGQFVLHYDYLNASQSVHGDRIATVLFYLSDVAQGGSTIFPFINLMVQPKKGDALLWYNMQQTGNVHLKSLHGSCPVIVGSKWVATKWLHVNDQMFRKRCYDDGINEW